MNDKEIVNESEPLKKHLTRDKFLRGGIALSLGAAVCLLVTRCDREPDLEPSCVPVWQIHNSLRGLVQLASYGKSPAVEARVGYNSYQLSVSDRNCKFFFLDDEQDGTLDGILIRPLRGNYKDTHYVCRGDVEDYQKYFDHFKPLAESMYKPELDLAKWYKFIPTRADRIPIR